MKFDKSDYIASFFVTTIIVLLGLSIYWLSNKDKEEDYYINGLHYKVAKQQIMRVTVDSLTKEKAISDMKWDSTIRSIRLEKEFK